MDWADAQRTSIQMYEQDSVSFIDGINNVIHNKIRVILKLKLIWIHV